MMNAADTLKKFGLEQAFCGIYRDPEKNILRLLDWADRFADEYFISQRRTIREAVTDPAHPYNQYIKHIIADVDPNVTRTLAVNFFIKAVLIGWWREEELRQKYQCNIPWAILLEPTSVCNLHCTGCWAANYGNRLDLTYDEINDIIRQGKSLGVYFYAYTGGEPLARQQDLIRLCEEHFDCVFLCFTNATLIDESFADEMLRVGNFVPAISLEGFETATNSRRGNGTYRKVMDALKLLQHKKLVYGISSCYTRANYESITSKEYLDFIREIGAYFIWYFHYMPVGNDAVPQLMPTPAQRRGVYERIRRYRAENPLFAMDFQNDAEYVGGCIAGGRRYLHINANGDINPCTFVHYSDSNIREKTLLDALRSPMLMAYHDRQPFDENMLRPCPMLENPEELYAMVNVCRAHSTDWQSPEKVADLYAKCEPYSREWAPVAEKIWTASLQNSPK